VTPDSKAGGNSRDDHTAAERRALKITVREMEGGGWESDVEINRKFVGGGTAPTALGAIDMAMDILYGDNHDWLNGDEGAIRVPD
jgi:hypothetical protein